MSSCALSPGTSSMERSVSVVRWATLNSHTHEGSEF
jgi:hypothetical protein